MTGKYRDRRYVMSIQKFFELLNEQIETSWSEEQKSEFRATWLAAVEKKKTQRHPMSEVKTNDRKAWVN